MEEIDRAMIALVKRCGLKGKGWIRRTAIRDFKISVDHDERSSAASVPTKKKTKKGKE